MAYDIRVLRGVGGWLAFFVIVLAVVGPLRTLASMLQVVGDPNLPALFGKRTALFIGLELILGLLSILGAWYLAWRLLKVQTAATVPLVIAGIWLIGPGVLAFDTLLLLGLSSVPVDAVAAGIGVEFVRVLLFYGIWTAYLLKSERVANTYTGDVQTDHLTETFS